MKSLRGVRRQAIAVSQEQLVETKTLPSGSALPLVVQPAVPGLNLTAWAKSDRQFILNHLLKYGGILFRQFQVNGAEDVEEFLKVMGGDLMQYRYGSTPRSQVKGKIYTSTEYPAEQSIPLHNEMAYTSTWPMKIVFHCVQPAEQGGQTPIADSRKVFQRIDSKIKEIFMDKKVMYVRNYSKGLDIPWQNVFETTSKPEVETYCRSAGIEFEWKDKDRLKTRQICQAVATHPTTNELVWFNQAHLFHVSNLKPEIYSEIWAGLPSSEFPRNAYYGDGSEIEFSVLEEIRAAYQEETITFTWEKGDIMLLDNMLAAHGRYPYVSSRVNSRKIIVGMAEPFSQNGELVIDNENMSVVTC